MYLFRVTLSDPLSHMGNTQEQGGTHTHILSVVLVGF
jgi:hypothetical protein